MSELSNQNEPNTSVGVNQNIDGGAVERMDNLGPRIFKLNVDCFEKVFESLSLKDLETLRLTCKRMKTVADYYIKLNYRMKLDFFRAFRSCVILEENFDWTEIDCFGHINHLAIDTVLLTMPHIELMKHILVRVDHISLDQCSVGNVDLYEDFLKLCNHLKRLSIKSYCQKTIIHNENENENGNHWLHQYYPELEYVEILNVDLGECSELEVFLKRNQNVQIFSTTFNVMWHNRNWMLESDIKFKRLKIAISSTWGYAYWCSLHFNLLNELHKRGFYQQLDVILDDLEKINDVKSIAALRRLSLTSAPPSFELPSTEIRGLYLGYRSFIAGSDAMANNLNGVQQIWMEHGSIATILPFIQKYRNLKKMFISNFENEIGDLSFLNNERKKLKNARKISIFLNEDIIIKNRQTQKINWSLVELKPRHLWYKQNPYSLR